MAGIGDLMALVRDLGAIEKKLEQMQNELAARTVEGAAGGGMVVATVNGRLELVGLKISPEVVGPDDIGLLEDMIKGAVSQANAKARDVEREVMAKHLGDLKFPPGLESLIR
jgi:hypothetical protein